MAVNEIALRNAKTKRAQARAACTRGKTFVDELGARQISVIELRQRQAKFRECWQAFEDAQSEIELVEMVDDQEIVHNNERQAFEQRYFEVDTKLEELIIQRTTHAVGPNPFGILGPPENRDNTQPSNVNMRLPRIELPTFSGAYEDWRPFHDVFFSMIHENTTLPIIQKLHYLKASLKGEASDVISSLELSAENYVEAWEMLNERYDNQRVIVQKHIKAIFDQPVLHKETHVELRQLLDAVLKHLRALKVLKRPTDKWDDLIIHIITSKLASVTNKEWETSLKDSNIPTLKELIDFLSQRCRALEAVDRKPQSIASSSSIGRIVLKKPTVSNVVTDRPACYFCKGDHPIFRCDKFLELSVDKRFQEVKGLKLCLNCLKSSEHRAMQCNASSCKKCMKKHNTLLHVESSHQLKDSKSQASEPIAIASSSTTSVNHTAHLAGHQVLLSTAVVHVQDVKGSTHSCRALLDNGSQSNFVTADLADKLGLKRIPTCVPINGVGDSKSETHSYVKVNLKSRLNGFRAELKCLVLRKITQDIPSVSINKSDIRIPPGIKLADPDFMESSRIDMLIGVEFFWDITCVGQIKTTETQPWWQKTHLGWIAAGGVVTGAPRTVSTVCHLNRDDKLNHRLTQFWEIEHGARKNNMSLEERKCEEHFESTVKRNSEGRFIVKLPIKHEEMSRMGQSKDTATRRFRNLERRLNCRPALKRDYTEFIHEYEALGHMRELRDHDSTTMPHYYMPHHCVLKKDNSTTKLRVVFDASCKTTSDVSLNGCLMVGPVLQQDLFSIITRFRTFKYVLVADITKMYRQVLVDESQVALQRIVWRDRPDQSIKEFELLTLTYGTGPASFLAVKSIRTLAEIEATNFPIGSQVVLRDFYVDDLITGSNTKEKALQIRDEVTKLLINGGFVLRKWASNNRELLEGIPVSSVTSSMRSLDREGSFKTLGIQWNPIEDVFQYKIAMDMNQSKRSTKRIILSCIAQIFDPLGLLGPVILLAKMLIQRLWTLQLDWDESLPSELHTEWSIYKSQLKQLNKIRIPRRAVEAKTIARTELHAFCDASQGAYGACVYMRVTDQDGVHRTRLLCSKSRVAPLKAVSMPRLELCGAQLLAQLIDKIVPILEQRIDATYCWTDSTIVIDWIKSPSRKFNTFVANRIGEIQELTTIDSWHHVRTNDNPADILSRGANPEVLIASFLWWNGPHWLSNEEASWPKDIRPLVKQEEFPEQRKVVVAAATSQEDFSLIERFSSYTRLVRTSAMCLRFAHNAKSSPDQRKSGTISVQELEASQKAIIKRVQRVAFHKEIEAIESQKLIGRDSSLLSLNPFLDCEGLLRVGGRLKNSNLSYASKHQLVLLAHHRLTQLIIEYEHKRLLHAGPQATLAAVRSRYWPIGARGVVRAIVHKCITCFKVKPRAAEHIMGDLPSSRVIPSRPFSNTGVDYCRPILVREGKRRNAKNAKAWIAIFVCLATKAVHIKLVSDLTAEGFLNALKRFISRRGRPSDIFSDNGTNFVGANRELEELRNLFNHEEVRDRIINVMAADAITWHFIPPRAPHFGGLWEAAVRSTKHHLSRVTSDGSLTFEEAATLLTQIEAILNSRPLTPLTSDPEDCSYLTPGHFLIGDSLIAYPEPSLQHLPVSRLSRWQLIEQRRQQFWKRWSVDYLHQMQQRTKWKRGNGPPIQLGQLVVVRENDLPPQSWLIGRIVAVHPGADEIIRTASVKTSKGIFKRPASKLCILPIET